MNSTGPKQQHSSWFLKCQFAQSALFLVDHPVFLEWFYIVSFIFCMAAEIPISLVKFHSLPNATADLFVIPWLSISQLRIIFFLSSQLRNTGEWINSYSSTQKSEKQKK